MVRKAAAAYVLIDRMVDLGNPSLNCCCERDALAHPDAGSDRSPLQTDDGHPSRSREQPQMRPSFAPTRLKAATAVSTSSRLCAAEIWHRTRACPCGTTGNPNPVTNTPS